MTSQQLALNESTNPRYVLARLRRQHEKTNKLRILQLEKDNRRDTQQLNRLQYIIKELRAKVAEPAPVLAERGPRPPAAATVARAAQIE